MFEHFTFGAQAHTTLFHPDDIDISASPTDTSFPLPSSSAPTSYFPPTAGPIQKGGMNDIVQAFSQQTLYPDEAPTRSIWTTSLPSPDFSVDSSIDDEFTPDEMSYVSTTRGMTTVQSSISSTHSLPSLPLPHPRAGTVACRRLQRQLNVQLQSCNSHIKDITSLVEDMISTNSQCRLHASKSSARLSSAYNINTPPPSGMIPSPSSKEDQDLLLDTTEEHFENREISPDEDEGFAEGDDNEMDVFALSVLEEEMSLRRASTPSGIRKYNVVRWRKSAECIGSNVARTKVRSVPRMRRRKVESVPE